MLTRNPKFFERVGFSLTKIDALPEKILKDCENCPKRARCDELAYEYNSKLALSAKSLTALPSVRL